MVLPAGEGGAPGSSGSVKVTGQHPDLLVRGANNVVDAVTVYAIDGVYGVPFQFTVPRNDWRGQVVNVYASNVAAWIQQIAQHEHVVGIVSSQDTNPAGQLRDVLIVTVGDPDGVNTGEVEIPYGLRDSPATYQLIDDTYANVARVAAIGN